MKLAKKLQLIEKHKKNFVVIGGPAYPALNGIHYAEDGTIYATDRYCVLRMKNIHMRDAPVTIHAVTGEKIRDEYPVRVLEEKFPTDFETGFVLVGREKIAGAVRVARLAKEIYGYYNPYDGAQLFSQHTDVILNIQASGLQFTVKFADYEDRKEFRIGFTPRFLYKALKFFEDAGTSYLRVWFPKDRRAPFLVSDPYNGIDIFILPCVSRSDGT